MCWVCDQIAPKCRSCDYEFEESCVAPPIWAGDAEFETICHDLVHSKLDPVQYSEPQNKSKEAEPNRAAPRERALSIGTNRPSQKFPAIRLLW
jgi:hypothetical protein